MSRPSCKNALLDSAEAVVMEGGGARLTLDAVAAHAGVSKGGVLYHFPTKVALLEGMIERLISHSAERHARIRETIPEGPARELRSEITSLLIARDVDDRVNAALLAAVANEPKLMETVRDFHQKRFEKYAEEGPGFERKALVLLAADGLFLLELLKVAPFDAAQRQALVDELLMLAEETARRD